MVYRITRRILLALARSFFQLRVVGKEHIVTEGGLFIASNHESYLDPPLVAFGYDFPIHFLARKTLFRGPAAWFYPIINAHPIDQDNPDRAGLKMVIDLLKSGKQVVVFPEGARTEDGNLQPAEPGTGLILARTKVKVQPVRIFGARECLPRGSGKVRFNPITVVVGEAFEVPEELLKSREKDRYQRIADLVMEKVAALEVPTDR